MSVKVTRMTALTWDETTPGAWKWLTFGQLCEIVERAKVYGIDADSFVYFHPEYAADDEKLRADRIFIDDEVVK